MRGGKMTHLSQEKAPIMEALDRYKKMRVVPFDVPGINVEEEITNWPHF